jgi:hypothetical protein
MGKLFFFTYLNLCLEYVNYFTQGGGLNVMIALNGESYRLMLFYLPSGHVLKMSGIQSGSPLLSLLSNLHVPHWTIIKKSFEIQQSYDPYVYVFDKIFVCHV